MADMNAALLHLRHGDFVRGWPLYRARHRMLGADPATIWPELPEWDGRPIAGRLRLITEQGIGDTIMFLTLLAAVRPRVGAVTLLVTARLTAPIQRSFPDIQVIAPDTDRSLGPLPPPRRGSAPATFPPSWVYRTMARSGRRRISRRTDTSAERCATACNGAIRTSV